MMMRRILNKIMHVFMITVIFLGFTVVITVFWMMLAICIALLFSLDMEQMIPLLGWAGLIGIFTGLYSSMKLIYSLLKE